MRKFLFILFLSIAFQVRAGEITVFAASSLTDVLTVIGKSYEKETSGKIRFNFDASSRQAKQISEGAQADLYFSADKDWSHFLEEKKIIIPGNSTELLSNELSLVTHVSNSIEVKNIDSLGAIKFKTLCLAQPTVPVGKFASEALKKSGIYSEIQSRMVHGDNARNVLSWVARNEADLAIVFTTDARAEKKVKELLRIPYSLHSPIIYPLSLVGNSPSKQALAFYLYLQGKTARSIFESFGFKMITR